MFVVFDKKTPLTLRPRMTRVNASALCANTKELEQKAINPAWIENSSGKIMRVARLF